jgi:hypothetical protein
MMCLTDHLAVAVVHQRLELMVVHQILAQPVVTEWLHQLLELA